MTEAAARRAARAAAASQCLAAIGGPAALADAGEAVVKTQFWTTAPAARGSRRRESLLWTPNGLLPEQDALRRKPGEWCVRLRSA
jgi:hypothetical protein